MTRNIGTIVLSDPLPFHVLFCSHLSWPRTARGFECGTALTFVCPADEDRLSQVEERLRGEATGERGGGVACAFIYMCVAGTVCIHLSTCS